MSGKVVELFPPTTIPHGGTFSNIITKPVSSEELVENIRNTAAMIKRLQMHVVPDEKLVLPPDWENRLSPELVAVIRRYLGPKA